MELLPANNRAIKNEKTTRSNRMKLRLIETSLPTVKNNVNAFHGNETGLSLRAGGGGDFPRILREWPPATFDEKQKKNRTKRNP